MSDSNAIPPPESLTGERVRILILDDDRATRAALSKILPEARFQVSCASSSGAVLEALEEAPFALLLTDFGQPNLDPHRFLRDVERVSPDTVVIAMTSRTSVKDAVAYVREGAYDVVTKPFAPDDMERVIERALKHQALCRYNEELKQKLAVSEKLAVIGRLAAGVAHELNSPLDGVLRFVNLSIDKLNDGHAVREYLVEARTGLVRMADIVRSLLRFSRNIVIENEPKNLHRMLVDAIAQVQHANSHPKLDVEVSLADPELKVQNGLFQVLTNLIKNAVDAIGDKPDGRLRIEAEEIDGIVEIRLRDNGCGIPERDRRKIFEPFFTTKEVGKGTGLGLSICARIVEKFDGTISLESEVGRGTTFFVRVPRTR